MFPLVMRRVGIIREDRAAMDWSYLLDLEYDPAGRQGRTLRLVSREDSHSRESEQTGYSLVVK